jgi:hypothetical protein
VLIDGVHVGDIKKGLERFNKIKWDRGVIIENAKKYSRENFENKFFKLVRDCSAKN